MSIYAKLALIQKELKSPKGQYNSFGNYKYRSCEDILEAVKPLCANNGAALVISDEIVLVGDRFYIKATATLYDTESSDKISNTAWAREEASKKGMDSAQVTGSCSSYARKYALNGLFCIDDTKDADTDEHHNETENRQNAKAPTKVPKQKEPEKKEPEQKQQPLITKDAQGNTLILAQGQYYKLSAFKLDQLNKMANSEKYAEIHDEVRMLMAYKSKRQ